MQEVIKYLCGSGIMTNMTPEKWLGNNTRHIESSPYIYAITRNTEYEVDYQDSDVGIRACLK